MIVKVVISASFDSQKLFEASSPEKRQAFKEVIAHGKLPVFVNSTTGDLNRQITEAFEKVESEVDKLD